MRSLQKFLPFAVMISLECLDVGLTTLSKAAFSEGLNHFVFVVYSNALAAIILCPLAFFVDRVEKVNMRSSSSQLKVLGTLISVGGAMVVTLYKGRVVRRFWSLNHDLHESPHVALRATSVKDWIIGSFFLAGASISWSIWNIMQVETLKRYPAELSITAFTTTMAAMQSAIFTSLAEHKLAVWGLKWNIDVISISYSAIIGTGLTYTMQTWCNSKKGPLFVSMFKPVGIVIAAIASAIFLGDKLHYGSVVGAFFIVLGFYAVIWGQSKDTDDSDELSSKGPVKCESNLIDNDPSEYKQLLGEHSHTCS